jgi:hypothetical protein
MWLFYENQNTTGNIFMSNWKMVNYNILKTKVTH